VKATLEKDFKAFIIERLRIFQRRQLGQPWPWTNDPILRRTKIKKMPGGQVV